MEVYRAQGLTTNTCKSFYINLQSLYNQHSYVLNYVWNLDEIKIQTRRQIRARVMAKRRSVDVYNTIPKSQEWLTINCAMMQGLFCQGSTFFKEKDYGMITLNFGN